MREPKDLVTQLENYKYIISEIKIIISEVNSDAEVRKQISDLMKLYPDEEKKDSKVRT